MRIVHDPTVPAAFAQAHKPVIAGLPFAGGAYTITEPTLTIAWGLVRGAAPAPRTYRRVR